MAKIIKSSLLYKKRLKNVTKNSKKLNTVPSDEVFSRKFQSDIKAWTDFGGELAVAVYGGFRESCE